MIWHLFPCSTAFLLFQSCQMIKVGIAFIIGCNFAKAFFSHKLIKSDFQLYQNKRNPNKHYKVLPVSSSCRTRKIWLIVSGWGSWHIPHCESSTTPILMRIFAMGNVFFHNLQRKREILNGMPLIQMSLKLFWESSLFLTSSHALLTENFPEIVSIH